MTPAFRKYLLLQIPGTALLLLVLSIFRESWGLSGPVTALIVAVWVAKDLVLYPFLRAAYESDERPVVERLVGERGRTMQPLEPTGYVRVRGELWRAEAADGVAIPAERTVVVSGVRQSILLVTAVDGGELMSGRT